MHLEYDTATYFGSCYLHIILELYIDLCLNLFFFYSRHQKQCVSKQKSIQLFIVKYNYFIIGIYIVKRLFQVLEKSF